MCIQYLAKNGKFNSWLPVFKQSIQVVWCTKDLRKKNSFQFENPGSYSHKTGTFLAAAHSLFPTEN